MLTSNAEQHLPLLIGLQTLVVVFDLLTIIQGCKWNIRPAYDFYTIPLNASALRSSSRSLKQPCAFSRVCIPCGIHTSAPPSLLTGRHLNQLQGSVLSYRINHEFPFFNISAKTYDHYQNYPEIHRIP